MESEARVQHEPRSLTAADETPFVNQRDPARKLGPDGKPAVSRRAPIWDDVPDEKWNDWKLAALEPGQRARRDRADPRADR